MSLPFQRLIRSHLAPPVLETLTPRADVVIASPFAEDPDFVHQYSGEKIFHVLAPTYEKLSSFFRKLIVVSDILRVRGYWYRNRKLLTYYWATRHIGFGENGNDKIASLPKRAMADVVAWIGAWPRAWILFDALVGPWCFEIPVLATMARQYENVTLVQASSWGFQDHALAWMARKHLWRKVFLPYTTDQLFCNGYLLSDFDSVCVQGTAELEFAEQLHRVTESRILKLGSLNDFASRLSMRNRPVQIVKNDGMRRVMFAGSIATYYPTDSEFDCLDHLLAAVETGELPNVTLTYRPLGHTPAIRALIEKRYTGRKHLEISYASATIFGLDKYTPSNYADSLADHLDSISGFDVAVMAGFSSLGLDSALVGTPSIAYFFDPSGTLERRKNYLRFDQQGRILISEAIPCVMKKEDLIPTINYLLSNQQERERISRIVREAWDYNPPNMLNILEDTVFGEHFQS